MKEFFGIGGYTREPEGYLSPEHLLFVTSLMAVMIALAIWLGLRNRNHSPAGRRVLMIAAILSDSIELFKMIGKIL